MIIFMDTIIMKSVSATCRLLGYDGRIGGSQATRVAQPISLGQPAASSHTCMKNISEKRPRTGSESSRVESSRVESSPNCLGPNTLQTASVFVKRCPQSQAPASISETKHQNNNQPSPQIPVSSFPSLSMHTTEPHRTADRIT